MGLRHTPGGCLNRRARIMPPEASARQPQVPDLSTVPASVRDNAVTEALLSDGGRWKVSIDRSVPSVERLDCRSSKKSRSRDLVLSTYL